MHCKLCSEPNADLRNSHIVPEFFFQGLYDNKHRFSGSSDNPQKPSEIYQKGFREPMLCQKCETQFSRYEKYGAKLFYANGGTVGTFTESPTKFHLHHLDYKKLKLLMLSILWRLSVADSSTLCSAVDVGPIHELRLRTMLLSEDPGEVSDYPTLLISPTYPTGGLREFFLTAICFKKFPNKLYGIVIGGLYFIFHVPGRQLSQKLLSYFLQKDGEWIFPKVPFNSIDALRDELTSITEAELIRRQTQDGS